MRTAGRLLLGLLKRSDQASLTLVVFVLFGFVAAVTYAVRGRWLAALIAAGVTLFLFVASLVAQHEDEMTGRDDPNWRRERRPDDGRG